MVKFATSQQIPPFLTIQSWRVGYNEMDMAVLKSAKGYLHHLLTTCERVVE